MAPPDMSRDSISKTIWKPDSAVNVGFERESDSIPESKQTLSGVILFFLPTTKSLLLFHLHRSGLSQASKWGWIRRITKAV
jgi:hypothetical protein